MFISIVSLLIGFGLLVWSADAFTNNGSELMFPVPAKPPLMSEYVAVTVPELSSRYISAGELSHKIQFIKIALPF